MFVIAADPVQHASDQPVCLRAGNIRLGELGSLRQLFLQEHRLMNKNPFVPSLPFKYIQFIEKVFTNIGGLNWIEGVCGCAGCGFCPLWPARSTHSG